MNFKVFERFYITIIVLCILVVFSGIFYNGFLDRNQGAVLINGGDSVVFDTKTDYSKNISVEISGNINYPGVYNMDTLSTLGDLIYRAGGIPDGNIDESNLEMPLFHSQHFIIENSGKVCIMYSKEITEKTTPNDIETAEDVSLGKGININVATKDELMVLPGIGDALSDRIIEYREKNGGFKTIDEIKNVYGIGDKTFEKIREFITLE